MAKGDGSIQQLGRNKWRVSVSFGKDPVTGKYRRATRVVDGTKADAKKVRDGMVRDHENGLRVDAAKVTFGEFARQWQQAKEASGAVCKQRSDLERRNVREMCAIVGELPIGEITPPVLEDLYARIRADREARRGKPISNRTMREVHATMRQIMKKAVNYDLILRNPCDRVETPKAEDPGRRSLSVSEGRSLLSALDGCGIGGIWPSEGEGGPPMRMEGNRRTWQDSRRERHLKRLGRAARARYWHEARRGVRHRLGSRGLANARAARIAKPHR